MSNIVEIKNDLMGDSYFKIKHKTGLMIIVYPKPEYTSTYAVFGTKYGSIDTSFKTSEQDKFTRIPEGTAHFLEHKLFESEDLDAFARYAKTGASANAYTSFDKTCYLFSCSDNFKESLEILLDFVQHPYFTQQTVQKEQGIIGQEIKMYEDVPDWQVMFNLLKIMYHNHPVKIDIAGTVDSISQITAQVLYECYNTFYNLNNMVLAVVGKTTVEEVLQSADRLLEQSEDVTVNREIQDEPQSIVNDYIEQKLPVSMPQFNIGFKESYETPQRSLKEQIYTGILLEIIAGDASSLYGDLFSKGLINTSFSTEYFAGYGYASVIFSGESRSPIDVKKLIEQEIEKLRKNGIDEQDFQRARKMLYGRSIMEYNDIDSMANHFVSCHFEGYELFDELDIYKNVTLSDIEERFKHQLILNKCALSVILPN
ncbi:MAG: insulinase family protein [Oscillospiraceae bacterium]|jgi:predicted Zn-dependent peptidase|nr:insulinase family protein [Oscillospiraceae bacterium]